MRRPTDARRRWRAIRSALLADLERFLAARLDRLDWEDAQRFGAALGGLAWRVSRRDRKRTLEHLALAFPDFSEAERIATARASFRHFGTILGENLWLRERGPAGLDGHVRLEGGDHLDTARAAGRTVLIVSGHCGNWELIHAVLNSRGFGLSVVARGLDDPSLGESLLAFRARFGTRTVVRGAADSGRALLRALRGGGGGLALLIDQDTDVDGVWVDFFGRAAWTPVGAAEMARRFRAAVHPVFSTRRADGRHVVRVDPELELADDPTAATQQMTLAIEEQIRRVPEQWVWMHRRWRRRPPVETR